MQQRYKVLSLNVASVWPGLQEQVFPAKSIMFPWRRDNFVLIGFYNSGRAESSKGGALQINLFGKGLTSKPSMRDRSSSWWARGAVQRRYAIRELKLEVHSRMTVLLWSINRKFTRRTKKVKSWNSFLTLWNPCQKYTVCSRTAILDYTWRHWAQPKVLRKAWTHKAVGIPLRIPVVPFCSAT